MIEPDKAWYTVNRAYRALFDQICRLYRDSPELCEELRRGYYQNGLFLDETEPSRAIALAHMLIAAVQAEIAKPTLLDVEVEHYEELRDLLLSSQLCRPQ